jgi:L-asparaginase II
MHCVALVVTTSGYPDSGYTVENTHMGSVAVVDAGGALPLVLADGPARLDLSMAELALLCASHSAEEKHVATVQAILAKIGCGKGDLECGCHAPLYYDSVGLPVPQERSWSPLHHNCSGKHSGFLAWCRLHNVPTAGYVARAHPVQQAVRRTLAATLAVPQDSMPVGMDGCCAPNYALPLAQLYARLAQGQADPQHGAAMGDLFDAMTTHPDLVSGQARCDLAYMTAGAGDWVSKVSADAVQAIGIRSAGLGIAIKIADGAPRVLQAATYSVLDQLGLLDDARRRQLAHYRQPELKSLRGATVGDIRAVLTLQRA